MNRILNIFLIIILLSISCKRDNSIVIEESSEKIDIAPPSIKQDDHDSDSESPVFKKVIKSQSDIVDTKSEAKEDNLNEKKPPIVEKKLQPKSNDTKEGVKKVATKIEKPKTKPKPKPSPKAKIEFVNTTFDFGRIVVGEKVQHEFVFKNTGRGPLVIKNAEASCGCTQPIYPFIPIESGETGKIFVQFNSTGRLGRQNPTIKIFSNAANVPSELKLVGEVITKEFK